MSNSTLTEITNRLADQLREICKTEITNRLADQLREICKRYGDYLEHNGYTEVDIKNYFKPSMLEDAKKVLAEWEAFSDPFEELKRRIQHDPKSKIN